MHRALSSALGYRPAATSQEVKLYRRALAGEKRIGTVKIDPCALAVIAIWRTLVLPKSTTLIVTPTAQNGATFIALAERMIARCEPVRQLVWIASERRGLLPGHSNVVRTLHGRPAELLGARGWIRSSDAEDILVMVPCLDGMAGYYLKEADSLVEGMGISLLANAI
jgi:hypothetical protein